MPLASNAVGGSLSGGISRVFTAGRMARLRHESEQHNPNWYGCEILEGIFVSSFLFFGMDMFTERWLFADKKADGEVDKLPDDEIRRNLFFR